MNGLGGLGAGDAGALGAGDGGGLGAGDGGALGAGDGGGLGAGDARGLGAFDASGDEGPDERQMVFVGVGVALPDVYPRVRLREVDPPHRELTFSVGTAEGVAIAIAWRRIETPRPFTHELFCDVLRGYEISVECVRIVSGEDGVYRAELVLGGATGGRTLACRPSDALALALRQPLAVPITVAAELLEVVHGEGAS